MKNLGTGRFTAAAGILKARRELTKDRKGVRERECGGLGSRALFRGGWERRGGAQKRKAGGERVCAGGEASNRKQEIDRQHYTIPNQRPKISIVGKSKLLDFPTMPTTAESSHSLYLSFRIH